PLLLLLLALLVALTILALALLVLALLVLLILVQLILALLILVLLVLLILVLLVAVLLTHVLLLQTRLGELPEVQVYARFRMWPVKPAMDARNRVQHDERALQPSRSAVGAVVVPVVGTHADTAAVDAAHARDSAGHGDRLVGLFLAVDIAGERDHAVDRLHVELKARHVAGGEQVGLDLGGDPGVVDGLVGLALGHLAVVAFLVVRIVGDRRAHRTGQQRRGEHAQGRSVSGRVHVGLLAPARTMHAFAATLGEPG